MYCTEKYSWIVYLTFLIGCLALFLHQTYICLNIYLLDKSVLSTESVSTAEAEFPALTVCPSYENAFKHDILAQHGVTANDIRNLRFPKNGLSSIDFYDMVTFNLTELLSEMQILLYKTIQGTKVSRVKFTDGSQ